MMIRGSIFLFCALPGLLAAQGYPFLTAPVEMYGYGGARDGHYGTVGAGLGLLPAKYGGYFLDVGYTSLGTSTVRRHTEPIRQSRLYDMALLGHIRIPLVSRKYEPYGIVGGGAFYSTFQVPAPSPAPVNSWVTKSDVNFAFHTGAGLRYYVQPNWGIRPELKVSISGQTFVGFTVGIFYQIPSD